MWRMINLHLFKTLLLFSRPHVSEGGRGRLKYLLMNSITVFEIFCIGMIIKKFIGHEMRTVYSLQIEETLQEFSYEN